jgi:hypothetical protein
LRCEFLQAPLGIDEAKPRLSWRLESSDPAARGLRQTAYQLLVASSREALDHDQGDLWDSGKVSGQANRCEYGGRPLTSRLACHWKVRAWDQDGKVSAWSAPALWTMGLLRPDDWSAKWILEDEAPPETEPTAPLFRKTFDLSAAPVRATVYVSSLGYHELYLNGQKVGRDVLAPQVSLMDRYVFYTTHDVSALVKEGPNCLGLWLGDGFVGRFFPYSRPQGIVQLEIECRDGSRVTITSDETWKTHPSHIRRIGAFSYGDYGGECFDCGRELPEWNVTTLNDSDWLPARVRITGTPTLREHVEMDVPDRTIVRTPAGTPVLRAQTIPPNVILREVSPREVKEEANNIQTTTKITFADNWVVFAPFVKEDGTPSGEDLARIPQELTLNGKTARPQRLRGSERLDLAPFLNGTAEGKTAFVYAALETDQDGQAVIGIGADWWFEAWVDGKQIGNTLLAGNGCQPVSSADHVFRVQLSKGTHLLAVRFISGRAGSVLSIGDRWIGRTWLVDMGQMITGWFAFSGQGTPEQNVTLHFLQALDTGAADAKEHETKDVIIPDVKGRVRSCNKFNYHTFRYVRFEGLTSAPEIGQIKAMLIGPGLTPAFTFACSNDLANRIHQASMNTLLANSIGGYISDCPDRERAGYGYGLAYTPFLIQHFAEGTVFLEKTIRDAVDAQRQDGHVSTASPVGPGGDAGKWIGQNGGGFLVQAPWQLYQYTGEQRALAASHTAAERYLSRAAESFFDQRAGLVNVGQWDFLADWYAVIDGEGFNPQGKVIQANSMYIVNLDCFSKRLEVLGNGEQAARYRAKAEAHRHLFHANYYKKAAANYGLDHMTYLAEPLLAQVPPKEETDAVFRALEHNIRVVAKGHPTSGDGGTHNLLGYLLSRNRPDLVYLMVNQTDPPSWGEMVKNGDAAIRERWSKDTRGKMWSRSHVGLGIIGEWFLNGLAGIQCDPAQPGFQHAILRPFIPPDMDSLAARSDSSHGTISIRWKKAGGAVSLEVAIPPNTTATLFLPTEKPDAVTESGRHLADARGVKLLGVVEGAVSVALESGAYAFAW